MESQNLFTEKTGKQNGLNAEYFNNMDLGGTPVLTRIDKDVNFNWDENGPGSGVAKDHYSVRWSGYIKVLKTGEYTIAVIGDDGMRLWLDDKILCDAWYPHSAMKRAATINLEKGKYYKVKFELFEKAGGAVGILDGIRQAGTL
jgi:mannan endo-1,4-beta-mannosidase